MSRMPRPDGELRQRWLVATTEYAGLTPYTGGIGRHYAALLPALARLGVTIDLLVFSDAPPLSSSELDGVNLIGYHVARRVPRPLLLPFRALRVRQAYRRRTYDRIFLPEWGALGMALPRHAPLLTNLATSMRLANDISGLRLRDFPLLSRFPVWVQCRLEDRQIRRSAGLVSISRAMLARTESLYTALPPARTVRNCIDVDHATEASFSAPLPAGWPEGRDPVVLFLGRLERRKGIEDALLAFAHVSERFPEARLVLAGASGDSRFEPNRAALLAHLSPPARDRVTWLGHVGGDELYRGIRESSVALCPSRWEGFGNVALEVKSSGTPLVCTSGSGFDDFCVDGRDTLMVPPANSSALAVAICRLLADPALGRELVRASAAEVQRFAPDPVAADLADTADELLAVRSSPSPSRRA